MNPNLEYNIFIIFRLIFFSLSIQLYSFDFVCRVLLLLGFVDITREHAKCFYPGFGYFFCFFFLIFHFYFCHKSEMCNCMYDKFNIVATHWSRALTWMKFSRHMMVEWKATFFHVPVHRCCFFFVFFSSSNFNYCSQMRCV